MQLLEEEIDEIKEALQSLLNEYKDLSFVSGFTVDASKRVILTYKGKAFREDRLSVVALHGTAWASYYKRKEKDIRDSIELLKKQETILGKVIL